VVPALTPGPGGGGGGGGGGEGWLSTNTGGGGGGGGAGGGALRLSAGEELVINGDVFALGGNGGGGAYPYPYSPPAPTFLISAGRGAGGGGGAGGALQLHGARWQSGFVLALGGESFRLPIYTSGPFPVDIRTAFERLLDQPATGRIRFDGPRPGQQVVPAPFSGPDLDYCFNLVSPSPQFQLKGHGTAGTLQVRVRDRLGNEQVAFPPAVDPVTGFTVAVPLYDGFNDIQAEFVLFGPPDVVWAVSAPVRSRTVLYLPGTTPSFAFACSISPATVTVPTERTVSFAVTVTGTPLTAVTWSVDGGAANGAVSQAGAYTAPCAAPSAPATVRVRSALDPSKSCTAQVTVIPGIAVSATAATGTAANPGVPSANVGQTVTIDIPAAVFALTGTGFASGQGVELTTVQRSATGTCTTSAVTVQGVVVPGLASLNVTVPPCADADQMIRVPGHGCARLQVVPVIASLNTDPNIAPIMLINGIGFVCGATEVYYGTSKVPDAQVLAVVCNVIVLGTRPAVGEQVTVRTKGGTSNAM